MAALQYGAMSNVDARWILEETVAKSMAFFWKSPPYFSPFFSTYLSIGYQILPPNSLFWRLGLGQPPEALCVAQLKANHMSTSSSSHGIACSVDGDGSDDDSNNNSNSGGGGGGGGDSDSGGHIQHTTIK